MKKIALVLASLFLFACTKSHDTNTNAPAQPAKFTRAMEIPENMPSIQLDPADKACVKDDDCTLVMTHCSCACSEAVAAVHAKKYSDRLGNMCSKYTGKMCKTRCAGTMKCQDKVCTYTQT